MKTTQVRIRKDYAPLLVAVSIAIDGGATAQVYDDIEREFSPDRQLSPLTLQPILTAAASDGSSVPYDVKDLSDIKWFVDNTDITTLSEWNGLYTIHTEGSLRGSIAISKNLSAGTAHTLRFEAKLTDLRVGRVIQLRSEDVPLSCVDVAEDEWSLSLEVSKFRYTPLFDRSRSANPSSLSDVNVPNVKANPLSWLKTVPVSLYRGKSVYSGSAEVTLRVTDLSTGKELTYDDDSEFIQIKDSEVWMDARIIDHGTYKVTAFVDNVERASGIFSIERVYPSYTIEIANKTSIAADATERNMEVLINCSSGEIPYPERVSEVLRIDWYTDSEYAQKVPYGEGVSMCIDLAKSQIGDNYTDDWLDVSVESAYKEPGAIVTDNDGKILVDANGVIYFMNTDTI